MSTSEHDDDRDERAGTEGLLAGVRIVDLAGEPAAMTGRILADLGAEVVKIEPVDGDPLRRRGPFHPDGRSLRFEAWNAGKVSVVVQGADDPALDALFQSADVVIDTPGFAGSWQIDPSRAAQAVWVSVTPFGRTGPCSHWVGTDLGAMAASGNMFSTGDPDRPPVRCTEPTAYAHSGPEAALAALAGLATGRPQLADVSMAETVGIASMGSTGRYFRDGVRGQRQGAVTGRTREIWPTKGGGFVSFGLRGGKARVPTLELITKLVYEDGIESSVLDRNWETYSPTTASADELRAMETAIGEYFSRHTMGELFDIACKTNLMLAPTATNLVILESKQLAAREYFGPVGDIGAFPRAFTIVRSVDGRAAPARPSAAAPLLGAGPSPPWTSHGPERREPPAGAPGRPAWEGTRILEFGSGAAGPIATRFFAEHGATVVRVESRTRPDFLRVYALGPQNPHGLEGADMFDALNVGKRTISLDLKKPEAKEVAVRLFQWADGVCENFAPKAMRNFGLDYDSMAALKPDLVMISACLNGNTGPYRDYPGFGGQGSALSGFNWLTGWPDKEPAGPFGTITDSLAPRFVAAGLAAGLLYHRRTGRGCYLDLAQVEAGIYTLSTAILDGAVNANVVTRNGNRHDAAVPHGAFRCADAPGDTTRPEGAGTVGDRWIAIACWDDEQWARLANEIGGAALNAGLSDLSGRRARIGEVEALVNSFTSSKQAMEIAERLQSLGIEAVPVNDFHDCFIDPQLTHRQHLVALTHPFLGEGRYERNGFRLSDADAVAEGYWRAGPTLGQDNEWMLDQLGYTPAEIAHLADVGALA